MNSREDKIKLLKEIASGKISPEDVPSDPLIVSKKEESFLGLMIAASVSPEKDGESKVFIIGEARIALDKAFEGMKERNEVIKPIK